MIRILPDLSKAKAHWVHRSSEIPDFIMVPMSNGQVVRYNPEIEHPSLRKIKEGMKNMSEMCVGYPAGGKDK